MLHWLSSELADYLLAEFSSVQQLCALQALSSQQQPLKRRPQAQQPSRTRKVKEAFVSNHPLPSTTASLFDFNPLTPPSMHPRTHQAHYPQNHPLLFFNHPQRLQNLLIQQNNCLPVVFNKGTSCIKRVPFFLLPLFSLPEHFQYYLRLTNIR